MSAAKNPVVRAKAARNRPTSPHDFVSRVYAHTHPTTTNKFAVHAGTAMIWSARFNCPVAIHACSQCNPPRRNVLTNNPV